MCNTEPATRSALNLNAQPSKQIRDRRRHWIYSRATTARNAFDEQSAAKHACDPQWEEHRVVYGEMPEAMRLVSVAFAAACRVSPPEKQGCIRGGATLKATDSSTVLATRHPGGTSVCFARVAIAARALPAQRQYDRPDYRGRRAKLVITSPCDCAIRSVNSAV
jgi:hypothetical protein